jgi:hypothetical protein
VKIIKKVLKSIIALSALVPVITISSGLSYKASKEVFLSGDYFPVDIQLLTLLFLLSSLSNVIMGLALEVIKIIALLCDIDAQDTHWTSKSQLKCQQYYVQCVKSKPGTSSDNLTKCIEDRKL